MPLENWLLVALLDAGIAVASVYRRRRSECRVLRLVPGSAMARTTAGTVRRARLVVAVLVSRRAMQIRVRDALGELPYDLRFTSTWAELEGVVSSASPAAILADPLADPDGDPERHLVELSLVRRVPILLHTRMMPSSAKALIRLGECGFRRVVIHPFGDDPKQLAAALEAVLGEGGGPPLAA